MAVIEVSNLTKWFDPVVAVDDLSFEVEAGKITGFLGRNGAGKTTTLRALLGLVEPTAGQATIFGQPYRELGDPARRVGAVLEAGGFHPGRSGRDHLRVMAAAAGVPPRRVYEVLGLVGLGESAGRRVRAYSMGMRQRLALATALLGDPEVLVLDEPANGLDPEGIRWLRDLLRNFARDGRCVLVSSHVLAEVAQTVDDVVIIHRGRLVAHSTLDELSGRTSQSVLVRSRASRELASLLAANGFAVRPGADGELFVEGIAPSAVGTLASDHAIALDALVAERSTLEDVFLELTRTDSG
jgi:ABC-2 type transport system ATP-binding protein